ncbi:MAG: T9SS type A sorting domain-containing protein [Prolixibacteraceae bacterium]
MKKIYTLIFGLFVSLSLYAVNVTLKVDMTGQDVSKGVFVTGELNAWAFTALTDEGNNIWSTTFDLSAGAQFIYYFMRNNSWDGLMDYREIIPAECANSNQKTGGWDGDRLITVPAANVVVNHIFGGCLKTSIRNISSESRLQIYPNPASGKTVLKLNGIAGNLVVSVFDLTGKQIQTYQTDKQSNEIELTLLAINKGIYFVKASNGHDSFVEKLIVQ